MTRVRNWTGTLLIVALAAAGLTGCAEANDKSLTPNVQSIKGTPNVLHNEESAGVLVRNDLALKINQIHGLRNASVLMHNGNAYVGLTEIGDETQPDPHMKKDVWKGNPYGTPAKPKSASGMTVQELEKEVPPNADTHVSPHSTDTGHLSASAVKQVKDLVRQNTPGVQHIFVTGVLDDVEQLKGYRMFITSGGNMARYQTEFTRFVRQAFPNAKNP